MRYAKGRLAKNSVTAKRYVKSKDTGKERINPSGSHIIPPKKNRNPRAIRNGKRGTINIFAAIEIREIKPKFTMRIGNVRTCAPKVILIISLR